jgi:hypothetical protein
MEAICRKLAELTGRQVDYAVAGDLHKFRFRDAEKPSHWLYVDRALIDDQGEAVVVQRYEEFAPFLNEQTPQRVTLTENGVFSSPDERATVARQL